MANENSILKDISIVGQEVKRLYLHFYGKVHFVFAVNFAMFLFLQLPRTLRVYDSILGDSKTKTAAKRENIQ